MKVHAEAISVPFNNYLAICKERRITVIKEISHTIFSITWKALLYAFILTIANVII